MTSYSCYVHLDFMEQSIGSGTVNVVVLYRMKYDQYMNTVPTVGFNCEKVKGQVGKSKGALFTVWDIGGQDKIRPLWNTYMHHSEGESQAVILFLLCE